MKNYAGNGTGDWFEAFEESVTTQVTVSTKENHNRLHC